MFPSLLRYRHSQSSVFLSLLWFPPVELLDSKGFRAEKGCDGATFRTDAGTAAAIGEGSVGGQGDLGVRETGRQGAAP